MFNAVLLLVFEEKRRESWFSRNICFHRSENIFLIKLRNRQRCYSKGKLKIFGVSYPLRYCCATVQMYTVALLQCSEELYALLKGPLAIGGALCKQ